MSCPRPYGKSLMQLGPRQRCHGPWVRAGYFPSPWLQSERIWICKHLPAIYFSPQMWTSCHLISECFGKEIHVPVWEAEGWKCGIFGFCRHRLGLWTFYIPLEADPHRLVLSVTQESFEESYISSQMLDDMRGQRNRRHNSPHLSAYLLASGNGWMQEIFGKWDRPCDFI